jgi:ATPase subunit of ABC transporter with duplicated ATPase domains
LSIALSSWGKKDGAVIVVSHDKPFCDSVGFNTVGTVKDGSLVVEQRELNESDWKQYDLALSTEGDSSASVDDNKIVEKTPEQLEEEKKRRKMAHNAPKLIAKLEKKIEAAETRIAEIDEEMMTVGNDVGKLTDLSNEKISEEEKLTDMMAEWEELELLLVEIA